MGEQVGRRVCMCVWGGRGRQDVRQAGREAGRTRGRQGVRQAGHEVGRT